MRGNMGCPCPVCNGAGGLHDDLKSILCGISRLLNVQMVITSGYRCKEHNTAVGVKGSRHQGDPALTDEERAEAKLAFAADFFPLDPAERDKWAKWGTKRYDFHAIVKPYFKYSYICVNKTDPRLWSIHGQIA